MCRAGVNGRRCPSCSTPEYKKHAAVRRKANRHAKKALVSWASENLDADTATAVERLKPSQIPAFLESSGLDADTVGIDVVPKTNGIDYDSKKLAQDLGKRISGQRCDVDFLATDDGRTFIEAVESDDFARHAMWNKPEAVERIFEASKHIDISENDPDHFRDLGADLRNAYLKNLDIDTGNTTADKLVKNLMDDVNADGKNTPEKIYGDEREELINSGLEDIVCASQANPDAQVSTVAKLGNGFYFVSFYNPTSSEESAVVAYQDDSGQEYNAYNTSSTWAVVPGQDYSGALKYSGGENFPTGIVNGLTAEEKQNFFHQDNHMAATGIIGRVGKGSKKIPTTIVMDMVDGTPNLSRPGEKGFTTESKRIDMSNALHEGDSRGENGSRITEIAALAQGKTFAQQRGYIPKNVDGRDALQTMSYNSFGVYPTGDKVSAGELAQAKSRFAGFSAKNHQASMTSEQLQPGTMESKVWENALSEDERNAIIGYTGSDYTSVSRAQRRDCSTGSKNCYTQDTATITDAIHRLEGRLNTQPRKAFRGGSIPRGMTSQEFFDSMEVGSVDVTTKITSTTKVPTKVFGFLPDNKSKQVTFVYDTKKGADVDSFSNVKSEMEIVLAPGSQFVLAGKKMKPDGSVTLFYADKTPTS